MVLSDRMTTISYKLSIATMFPYAAVWPQFLNATFQPRLISRRISETVGSP